MLVTLKNKQTKNGRIIERRLKAELLVTHPRTTQLLCFPQSGQQRIVRLPQNCWVLEYSTVPVNQRWRSHNREGGYWTQRPGVQLLPLLQLLLENHSAEDWTWECGCRTGPGLHSQASSRKQAEVAGTWPPIYFSLPNIKPLHTFCKAGSAIWQRWMPVHHISQSKGYGFHILGMFFIRLCV